MTLYCQRNGCNVAEQEHWRSDISHPFTYDSSGDKRPYYDLETESGCGLLDFLNPVWYDREGVARIIRSVELEASGHGN